MRTICIIQGELICFAEDVCVRAGGLMLRKQITNRVKVGTEKNKRVQKGPLSCHAGEKTKKGKPPARHGRNYAVSTGVRSIIDNV
jgi:hypothetical protein